MTPFGFIEFVPSFVNLVLLPTRRDLSGSQVKTHRDRLRLLNQAQSKQKAAVEGAAWINLSPDLSSSLPLAPEGCRFCSTHPLNFHR